MNGLGTTRSPSKERVRRGYTFSAAALLLLLLFSCGPTQRPFVEQPTVTPRTTLRPDPSPVPPTEKPSEPIVLRMNLDAEPPTLDPALATDTTSVFLDEQLFLGLTRFDDASGAVDFELAENWEISADGTVYTFHMRQDVSWIRYDPFIGNFEEIRPVTAYDIVYGVRRTIRPETASDYAYILYILKNAQTINSTRVPTGTYDIDELGVRAVDDYTIQFELEYPAGFFPAIAGMWVARPQPQEAIEEYGIGWTEPGRIMTNGAYALAEWTHDSHLRLVKNPLHYKADEVQIDVVDLPIVREESTAFAMYGNSELDTVSVPLDDIDRIKSDPVLSQELHIAPIACTYYYGFTTTKPPMDDVRVRRAFSYAINRQSLIDNVLKGGQLPANTFACPGIFGSPAGDPQVGIFYDPDQARFELAEAGYANGNGFPNVTLMHNTSETHGRIAQAIQQMWQETLGVSVNIENQEWKVFLDTISHETPIEEMPHIWRLGWCADYPDENNWVHEVFNPEAGANRPRMRVDDPQVGEYVQAFGNLTKEAAVEQNAEKRIEMYRQAEHTLVYEIAAITPIYYYTSVMMTKPYLQRTFPVLGNPDIATWRIEQ